MKVVCPNCRKMTRINKEKGAVYCQYCGGKFEDDKSDYEIRKNITVNKHYYDEAKIKQIEYNQKKDKKKEKREKEEKRKELAIFIVLALFLCGVFVFSCRDTIERNFENIINGNEKIIMEGSSDYYSGKSSEDVQEELEKNGFYNIEIVKDSNAGFLTELFGEENTVSKVTINGEEVVAGEKYWEDEEIVIYVFKK